MITPLDSNEQVDEISTRRLVNFMLESGVDGFFLLGTMGEGVALSYPEKIRLVEIVLEEVKGRKPVLVGTGDSSLKRTLNASTKMQELGVDALVVTQPSFPPALPERELERYFFTVARELDAPVVIYNNPNSTGNRIPLATLERLAAEPGIVGTKDSTGDFGYLVETLAIRLRCGKDFRVLEGDEWAIAPAVLCGADGAVPGIGSLAGKLVRRIYEEARLGNREEAMELQFKLIELFRGIYGPDRKDWLAGHKEALAYLGIISNPASAVYMPLSDERRERVRKCVEEFREYLV